MATGDRIYVADKPTLDEVLANVNDINSKTDKLDVIENKVNDINLKVTSTGQLEGVDLVAPLKLPYNYVRGTTVVYRGELHIFGGNYYPNYHTILRGDRWITSALPANFNNNRYGAVVYRDKIHLFTGNYHGTYDGTSWTQATTLPLSFSGAVAVYNDQIYLMSGTRFMRYSGDNNSWTELASINNQMTGALLVVQGNLHLFLETAHYSYNNPGWTTVSTLPVNATTNLILVHHDELHILSVGSGKAHYVFRDGGWYTVDPLPYAFNYGSAVSYNNDIHLVGGESSLLTHCILKDSGESTRSRLYGKRYYLQEGTRITCDNSKTLILSGVTKESYGYRVSATGYVDIIYTDLSSRSFLIS